MTVCIADAQSRLPELIAALKPGETVVITANDQPVARLVAEEPPKREPRKLGTLKGTVLYMVPDFDATPEDFKDFM
jgi:antitoxin (DNA-binding transcriptional repressor) of toxin-antitoxin stability system